MERTYQTEVPFIIPISVSFAVTPQTVYADPPSSVGDVEVTGLMTDFANATGYFSLNQRAILSNDQVPLSVFFGRPDTEHPIQFLEKPFLIAQGQRLRCDLVDVALEGAGNLFLHGRQLRPSPRITIDEAQSRPSALNIASGFTGTLNEVLRQSTPIIDEHFLLLGFHTDLDAATLRIFGVDGIPWNEDVVQIWAIASRNASVKRPQRLNAPYLVPAGNRMVFEFTNAGTETGGAIYLRGLQVPQGALKFVG